MDKMKIKKIFLTLTIIFASCILITACNIPHDFTQTKAKWDPKTKTYTDNTVKMTYIKTSAQDVEYKSYDDNQKIDLKTVNVKGRDRIAIRVYWKLENNSENTISFETLYAHAIDGIPSVSSVTQGGKKETLMRVTANNWILDDKGYYADFEEHKDLKPGESVMTYDTYSVNDTTTPIEIYFNKYDEDKSIGSYKISWEGPQITMNQLTRDAITKTDKMAETNKKEDAAKKEEIKKTLEGITVDEKAKSTWTKADYDALVADYDALMTDYGGNGTKLTDILAKYPHPNYKEDGGEVKLQYGFAERDGYVALSFKQVSESSSEFRLVSKSEKGLK